MFDAYWRFAAERQRLFMRRVISSPYPWTDDPVLRRYRFTNAYRAADRVSQYLIRHVLYEGPQTPKEVFFRALLFKLFNRIDTWEALVSRFGTPTACGYRPEAYARVFDALYERGSKLYSAAYIVPNPNSATRGNTATTCNSSNSCSAMKRPTVSRTPTRWNPSTPSSGPIPPSDRFSPFSSPLTSTTAPSSISPKWTLWSPALAPGVAFAGVSPIPPA